jgi:hypothetical protein
VDGLWIDWNRWKTFVDTTPHPTFQIQSFHGPRPKHGGDWEQLGRTEILRPVHCSGTDVDLLKFIFRP